MHPINEARTRVQEASGRLSSLLETHLKAADGRRGFNETEQAEQARAERDLVAAHAELDRLTDRQAEELAKARGRISLGEGDGLRGGVGKSFAQLFGEVRDLRAQGWTEGGASAFYRHVGMGLHHPALQASTMIEGIGSDGGHLVPEELVSRALDGAVEDEAVLRLVTVEPMTSETKRIAGFATQNHSAAGPFGFSGGWIAEGASMTAEKALVKSVKLQSKKLALLVQASNEVASDGLGFDAQLDNAMRKALGWLLADAVFVGTGAGQPLGIVNAPCTVTVSKEGGQSADTIYHLNIIKMLSRLLPSSMSRATFFASHTTRPQLMQLSVPVGTAGSYIPLQVDANGQYRLLGIPLFWTEHLPVLGDKGDLVLGDFVQYALGLRKQITLDRSAHVGFSSDLMTYRGIVRADGFPVFDAAFTPKNGDTQSPFVVLEAR